MAAVTGLTLIKRFTYRDVNDEEFSNTYHFNGPPPGDPPSWLVLANDLINLEAAAFPTSVLYAAAYGYDSDDPSAHAVWSHDFDLLPPNPRGTFTPGASDHQCAGDQAACVWWKTDQLTVKGKPIYLRKFMHAAFQDATGAIDGLSADYLAALNAYGGSIAPFHGGLRSQIRGGDIVARGEIPWITTRTLKKRGKKKASS